MATVNSSDPIPLFPADINRDQFGHFLSGLVAGEGSFILYRQTDKRYPNMFSAKPVFSLSLRTDDSDILVKIRSFFGCGRIQVVGARTDKTGFHNSTSIYVAFRISDLAGSIIPHFDRYPMFFAKKSRDFMIWKEAVLLCEEVSSRPQIGRRGYKSGGGSLSKWKEQDRNKYNDLMDRIRDVRRYPSEDLPQPEVKEYVKENPGNGQSDLWLPGFD